MKLEKIFYDKIKEKGYTLEEFAKELGFSRQNLHKHMKNLKKEKISFTGESLIKIKKLLDFDLLNFFWFQGIH